jgi:hypothetical protein
MSTAFFTLAVDVGKPENVGWTSSEHPTEVHDSFDQAISRLAFEARWPNLKSDVTDEPAVNLAVAAALAIGLAIDPGEIGIPCIVIAANQ